MRKVPPSARAALPSESLPTAQKAVSDGANRDHKSGYTLANRVRQKRWSHRRRATNSLIPTFDDFAVDFGKADEISVSFLSDMHAAHVIYELQAYMCCVVNKRTILYGKNGQKANISANPIKS